MLEQVKQQRELEAQYRARFGVTPLGSPHMPPAAYLERLQRSLQEGKPLVRSLESKMALQRKGQMVD